jgi:hypothetical protein
MGDDNIKMGLKAMRCNGVERIHIVQNTDKWRAVVNVLMNLRVS